MAELANFFVAIGSKLDAKGLNETIDKIDEIDRETKNITAGFRKAGAALTAFAVGGAAAIIKLTDKASDLEETTAKFNTVFQDQIGLAEEWSDQLVKSYGVSTEQSKRYLAAVQDLLVPMGMQSDAAAELSNEIVKLSVDLGSFNNMPTEKVMLDIQSALVGNFETMKKYGVVLNATRVEQHIMNQNLVDSEENITQAMKAQAAYELIMKGSQAALGDFNRTADGFANQVKIMRARIEDFAAKLGEKLIPTMKSVVKLISDAFEFLQNLNPAVITIAAKMLLFSTALAAVLGPMALMIGFLPQIVAGLIQIKTAVIASTLFMGPWVTGILTATVAITGLVMALDTWIDSRDRAAGKEAQELKGMDGRIAKLEQQKEAVWDLFRTEKISQTEAFERVAQLDRAIAKLNVRKDEEAAKIKAVQDARRAAEEEAILQQEALALRLQKTKDIALDAANAISSNMAMAFQSMINDGLTAQDAIAGIFENIKQTIIRIFTELAAQEVVKTLFKFVLGVPIPGFANGVRNFAGGLAVVGEKGPELVNLPSGTNVTPTQESKEILRTVNQGGTSVQIGNVTVQGTSDMDMARRQAEMVAEEVWKKVSNSRKV